MFSQSKYYDGTDEWPVDRVEPKNRPHLARSGPST